MKGSGQCLAIIIGLVLLWTSGNARYVFSDNNQISPLVKKTSPEIETAPQPFNNNLANSAPINGHMSPIKTSGNTSDTSLQTAIPFYFIGVWDYAILVEKSTQQLYLYDKHYKLIKTFHVTTGKNQGDKGKSGDRKTPEGIYFFTVVKDKRELLPEYGVMAMPINYPNFIDTTLHKKGTGIWLHATDQPDRPLKPYDTRGCVVAANEDILELAEYVKLQTTPVVIVDKIQYDSDKNIADTRRIIEHLIEKWQTGWQKKEINRYMDTYSKNFRTNGMGFERWKRYKESLNRQYKYINVSLSDIKILRHNNHMVVSFAQRYKNDRLTSVGIKRLYLVNENAALSPNASIGEWKIIGEEWSPLPTQRPADVAKRYTAYKMAKTETLKPVSFNGTTAKTTLPPDRTVLSKTPLIATFKGSPLVDIVDFAIDKEKAANKVKFKLINKTMEHQIISGRVIIIAANQNDNGIRRTAYPPMTIGEGNPVDFRKGEWFSIRRFKIVNGELGEKDVDHVTVLIYSRTGELLLRKEFPM